jgi:hypothetical protein
MISGLGPIFDEILPTPRILSRSAYFVAARARYARNAASFSIDAFKSTTNSPASATTRHASLPSSHVHLSRSFTAGE